MGSRVGEQWLPKKHGALGLRKGLGFRARLLVVCRDGRAAGGRGGHWLGHGV